MEKIRESIKEFLFCTKNIIGLEGIKLPYEEEVDENDLLEVLELAQKGDLGKGNLYSAEMKRALFCEKMSELVEEDELKVILSAYANFLLVDSLVKYVLFFVSDNGYLEKELVTPLNNKVQELNEYIRKKGPMDTLKDCIDGYLSIGHLMLAMVALPIKK